MVDECVHNFFHIFSALGAGLLQRLWESLGLARMSQTKVDVGFIHPGWWIVQFFKKMGWFKGWLSNRYLGSYSFFFVVTFAFQALECTGYLWLWHLNSERAGERMSWSTLSSSALSLSSMITVMAITVRMVMMITAMIIGIEIIQ